MHVTRAGNGCWSLVRVCTAYTDAYGTAIKRATQAAHVQSGLVLEVRLFYAQAKSSLASLMHRLGVWVVIASEGLHAHHSRPALHVRGYLRARLANA
jgi:hypothetical protein